MLIHDFSIRRMPGGSLGTFIRLLQMVLFAKLLDHPLRRDTDLSQIDLFLTLSLTSLSILHNTVLGKFRVIFFVSGLFQSLVVFDLFKPKLFFHLLLFFLKENSFVLRH